jgi:hypothetical protein
MITELDVYRAAKKLLEERDTPGLVRAAIRSWSDSDIQIINYGDFGLRVARTLSQ